MIHTLLGPERFRRGTDLYFERHDGAAVTTEDFVRAMEEANGVDLGQFRRWYSQAGTPVITVTSRFDNGTLDVSFTQRCPPTPGQPSKAPFHIPVAIGLLDRRRARTARQSGLVGRCRRRRARAAPASRIRAMTERLIVHVTEPTVDLRVTGLNDTTRVERAARLLGTGQGGIRAAQR